MAVFSLTSCLTLFSVVCPFVLSTTLTQMLTYEHFRILPCNRSRTESSPRLNEPIQVTEPVLQADMLGKPFYCVYEFQAPSGYHVKAEVRNVITGDGSYNHTKHSCGRKNYLRIWDGFNNSVWKPTELCGRYQENTINVQRIVSGREMKVEFRVHKFTEQTSYDVRVSFDKNEISHEEIETRFGGYNDVHGLVPKTICDWNIEVNRCIGFCRLNTPGYPGIYPPHSRCKYKLTNKDGERVEIYLSGLSRDVGKFDLRRSTNCTEDKVIVYDGATTADPIIGIFCGSQTIPEIISTGSSLLIVLETYAGSPPWHYSGFDARITHRFSKGFDTGIPKANTMCDWNFNSSIDISGYMHTPDYPIKEDIQCIYSFYGNPKQIVEFEISITSLMPYKESIYMYFDDDKIVPSKIWNENQVPSRRELSFYNSTRNDPVIVYELLDGQLSKAEPIFIYYRFIQRPDSSTVSPLSETPGTGERTGSKASQLSPFMQSVVLTILIITLRLAEVLQ